MRASIVIFLFIVLLGSCRDKVICPAFQSTYILDDSTRYAYYSYVWKLDENARQEYLGSLRSAGDSLPSDSGVYTTELDKMMPYYAYAERIVPPRDPVQKTKFGIVKYEPYWLKNYKLRTAPKENVRGPEKEEEAVTDEGEFYASDFQADSLMTDSTSLAGGDSAVVVDKVLARTEAKKTSERKYLYRYREDDNFNVEQEYYNKYFGEQLVDNRPPPPEVEEESADSLASEKGGFFDFIKNLFSKKEPVADSTAVDELGADFLPPEQSADSVQQN